MPKLTIPTLRHERLRLEPLSPTHSAGMFALWSRAEVCRYSGPAVDAFGDPVQLPAVTPLDSDRILDFFVRRAAAGLGFRWALITASDNRFVGALGFNHLGACPELAYHLHPDAWGAGLMTEATRLALDWVAAAHHARQVEAFIEPANTASIALVERLGFAATGEAVEGAGRYVARLRGACRTV